MKNIEFEYNILSCFKRIRFFFFWIAEKGVVSV